ncbi:MAG: hypothetical protein ISS49_13050 [Anaerolineae bacterium]|nr:hypothetical protein [Anaerolineae bacterium]
MNSERDLAQLWRQIAQDYDDIRREQEQEWASFSQGERVYLTEQLLLFLEEVDKREEEGTLYARDVVPIVGHPGRVS